jgi:molybdopterin synthase sulfur carrier subunit
MSQEVKSMATVWIPAPLRKFTDTLDRVVASGTTVAEIIEDLDGNFDGLKNKLCEDDGKVRRFVNIYVNNQDIRFLQNLDTMVADDDEISIMPAIAGGNLKSSSAARNHLAEISSQRES